MIMVQGLGFFVHRDQLPQRGFGPDLCIGAYIKTLCCFDSFASFARCQPMIKYPRFSFDNDYTCIYGNARAVEMCALAGHFPSYVTDSSFKHG